MITVLRVNNIWQSCSKWPICIIEQLNLCGIVTMADEYVYTNTSLIQKLVLAAPALVHTCLVSGSISLLAAAVQPWPIQLYS